jgi:mRNA deadenylase 3'-5' endonuclease subunit Ccr4
MSDQIKIVSFNVLSSKLATPKVYHKTPEEYLDKDKRYQKLENLLKDKTHEDYIVCLQEVSQEWRAKLELFFYQNDYRMVARNYHTPFSDYMGIVTAFPNKKYTMKRCGMVMPCTNIGEILDKPKKEPITWGLWLSSWIWTPKKEVSIYDYMKRKSNVLLMVELGMKGHSSEASKLLRNEKNLKDLGPLRERDFVVANYHAPCVFWNDKIQLYGCVLINRELEKFSQAPKVLCGDFNMLSDSPAYKYMIKSRSDDEFLHLLFDKNHRVTRSAFLAHHGKEPDFTYKAQICCFKTHKPKEYSSTLDYMFLYDSNNWAWKVQNMFVIPEKDDYLPSKDHMSDHRMLDGTFELEVVMDI